MSAVVVRSRLNLARSERQHPLGSFECLNLRFLVHAYDERSSRRGEVEAHDVVHFLDELRIATDLERTLQMRLQIVRSQNLGSVP